MGLEGMIATMELAVTESATSCVGWAAPIEIARIAQFLTPARLWNEFQNLLQEEPSTDNRSSHLIWSQREAFGTEAAFAQAFRSVARKFVQNNSNLRQLGIL